MRSLLYYRDILWDWNGTILDDVWLVVEIMNMLLVDRSLPPTSAEAYRADFTFPVEEYYRTVGFDLKREAFPDLARAFLAQFDARIAECTVQPGVMDLLEHLRASGRRQWILSATQHETLQVSVRQRGITRFFESLHGVSDEFARSKEATAKALVQANNLDSGRTLVIGDTTHDYEVACSVGADSLLVATGHMARSRLEATGAPVVESLLELAPEVAREKPVDD